jgi:hypothetical protein
MGGVSAPVLVPRRAAATVAELVAGATERAPMRQRDGKSGSTFERVVIGGERFVLKHLHPDQEWIARTVGDLSCWPVRLWTSGLLDLVPASIDHTVVGAAAGLGRNGWGGALLMRDVTPWLVPEGDGVVPLEQHLGFLEHMAELHARFWDFQDTLGLLPLVGRYQFFCPGMVEVEEVLGWPQAVPRIAAAGWARFRGLRHPAAGTVLDLWRDPSPLVAALAATPQTFLHGDWKMGNLGRDPDGRTILLDWAYPGRGPASAEVAWYLALNSARLPHSKEDAIEAYRAALERHRVATSGWWERQVGLALLGALVQFGWEKALGGEAELGWWLERAEAGISRL